MNYHGMEPEQHLKFIFNAEIEPTGQRRYLKEDMQIYHRLSYNEPMPQNMAVRTENEIAIKMGEHDYENFMRSYGKYLELVYETERDPVARDMLEKLSMYLILKR